MPCYVLVMNLTTDGIPTLDSRMRVWAIYRNHLPATPACFINVLFRWHQRLSYWEPRKKKKIMSTNPIDYVSWQCDELQWYYVVTPYWMCLCASINVLHLERWKDLWEGLPSYFKQGHRAILRMLTNVFNHWTAFAFPHTPAPFSPQCQLPPISSLFANQAWKLPLRTHIQPTSEK